MRTVLLCLAALALTACTGPQRPWKYTPFNAPPGAPPDVWDRCFNEVTGLTHRRREGPSEAADFFKWTQQERTCEELLLMKECLDGAHNSDMAASVKAEGKARLARMWGNYEDAMEDEINEKCPGGGTSRVKALHRYLRNDAQRAGEKAACAC